MKQAFAGAVLAAVVFTAAGFAYSTTRPNAVTPGQFNALKKRVAKLEKDNAAVVGYIGTCLLKWEPVTQYGNDSTRAYGYLYSADGSSVFLGGALDFTIPGTPVSVYLPGTTNASCATSAAFTGVHFARLHGAAPKIIRSANAVK